MIGRDSGIDAELRAKNDYHRINLPFQDICLVLISLAGAGPKVLLKSPDIASFSEVSASLSCDFWVQLHLLQSI